MANMNAYIIDNRKKTVHLKQVPKPECEPDGLLLKNLKWSICRTDVSQVRNELGEDANGKIPGHEVLGEVVESRDPRFREGDRVVYMGATDFGGAAQFRAVKPVLPEDPIRGPEGSPTAWFWTKRDFYDVPGAAIVKINPDNLVLENFGSLLEPLSCIMRAMEKFPPRTGQNAVILGGGCIGMLALQCLKNLYGAAEVAVLDIDENKLKRIKETYPEYGDSLKTFHLREPSSATRSSVLPHLEYHPKRLVNYNLDDYITLLMHEHDDLRQLIEDTHGAFADYLFEALPPLPEDKEFPHTRFLGANLLSPSGQYVLFSAEGIEEKTKFFWPVLAKGLALHPAGFDQRSVPMPRTAVDLHMAHAYVNAGIIDLQKLVTCTVDFTNETSVQQAFANYGQGEHMWKTVVKIA